MDLKDRYDQWNIGAKLIFFSAILAIIALILPWQKQDVSIFGSSLVSTSQNGFQGGWFWILLAFIYPLFVILTSQKMLKVLGYICAALAIGLTIKVFFDGRVEFLGDVTYFASTGLYLFLAASIGMAVGVWKY